MVRDAETYRVVHNMAPAAPAAVIGVSFSPDGKRLTAEGADVTVSWDVPPGR
jgi:hypothetical protein